MTPTPEFPPLPGMDRSSAPFRIGSTSYVYPADILPNVRALAGRVDDIELVFFESPDFSNIPGPEVVSEMRSLAAAHNLTFSVHFPIDRKLGSPVAAEREALLAQMLRLIDLARPLPVSAYVLHVEGITAGAAPDRLAQWQDDAMPLLARVAAAVPSPDLIAMENLAYPFEWCDRFLDTFGFSVCLDAGHLWEMGYDWQAHVARYLPRTRIIHLYGPGEGSRHLSLSIAPRDRTAAFLKAVAGFRGVLTLETFGYDDTASSLGALAQCMKSPSR